ncbi:MAG: oligosaccharide flippase family protein [Muribaculaceae bacterium]|nr:oligosaccharide flippase family protein [Muribaculaceae bacterium]
MAKAQTTSRKVFKALSLFGSVQVIMILCSVVRTKVIALWLGPAGIGIFGLYNNALAAINQLVQLNMHDSSVREMSGASAFQRARITGAVRRLGWLLGLAGGVLTVALSPLLSRWTFGDSSHTLPFILLSVVVVLGAVAESQKAMLQAHQLLTRLARATLWGGVVATVLSIILVWLYGYNGIVPSIIVFAVGSFVAYAVESRGVVSDKVTNSEALSLVGPIVRLGIYMTVAIFITVASQYAFQAWLRARAGEDELGLFQAGYTLVNKYVGLAFVAMSVEFFPRLSSVVTSRRRTQIFVCHEMSMLMLGITGCVVLFINLVPLIINILYDSSFAPASGYVIIATVGTLLKALSFVFAYVIVARGDGMIYLVTEGVSAGLYLVFNIMGYKWGGLDGIGIAYVVWYLAYTISVYLVYRFRYHLGGVSRQFAQAALYIIIVAIQAALCFSGHYLFATILSVVLVPTIGLVFYRQFLKRRTLKA